MSGKSEAVSASGAFAGRGSEPSAGTSATAKRGWFRTRAGNASTGAHPHTGPGGEPSLKRMLMLLVAIAALPMLLLSAAEMWLDYSGEHRRIEGELLEQANATALVIDGVFARAEMLLQGLSEAESIRSGNLDAIEPVILDTARKSFPEARILVVDSGGMVLLNSSWARGERRANVRGASSAAAALASGHAEISDLFSSPLDGAPSVAVCIPIPAAANPAPNARALCLGFSAARFMAELGGAPARPDDRVLSVLDRNARIVARSRDIDRMTGMEARPTFRARLAHADRGTGAGLTAEKHPAIIAFSRAPQSRYVVVLSVREAMVEAALRLKLAITLGVWAVLACLTLGAALLIARRVSRAATRLVDGSAEEEPAGPVAPTGVLEMTRLAAALRDAARARRIDRSARRRQDLELRARSEELRVAVEAAGLGVWSYDYETGVMSPSTRAIDLHGPAAGSGDGRLLDTVHHEDRARVEAALDEAIAQAGDLRIDYRVELPDGGARWLTRTGQTVAASSGAGGGMRLFGVVLDITGRKATETILREAVAAREVLVREADHRIKNSLQLVTSLMTMQRIKLPDTVAKAAFDEAIGRIGAIAEVHRALCQSADLSHVAFADMLRDISGHVGSLNPAIRIECDCPDSLTLDAERAIPLGLMLSELLTNAAKHAYPGGHGGLVRVQASLADTELRIVVSDDGVGFDAPAPGARKGTPTGSPGGGVGGIVLEALSRQAGAVVKLTSVRGKGTLAVLTVTLRG